MTPPDLSQPKSKHSMFPLPKQYTWNIDSAQHFINTLKMDEFQSELSSFEKTDFVSDKSGVELATEQFTNLLNEISLISLKTYYRKKTQRNKPSKRWFDDDCKLVRKSLKVLSNRKHRDPCNQALRQEYNTAHKNSKKLIKLKKNALLNSKITNLVSNKGNQEFWTYLKSINEDNRPNKTEEEIPIDNLFTHFKNLHGKPNPTHSLTNEISTLEGLKETHNYLDDSFSLKEIETAAKLLKSKRTPGSDRIRNEMLKTRIQYLRVAICKLFNLILKCGFLPTSWCEGIMTPIYKSRNRVDPSNYQGICINNCLGKPFTLVLNIRLQHYLSERNILRRGQIEFLPNHRTSDHIFTLRTLIDKHVTHSTKGKLFTCFIDFKKAFDSIWHDVLF